jgi:hypothetical protein
MDQIIKTLEISYSLLNDYANTFYDDERDPQLKNPEDEELVGYITENIDNVAILLDNFKDTKKEIDDMFAYHAEREPVAHLVEDPASGETLSDSSATKEDDLDELDLSKCDRETKENFTKAVNEMLNPQ